MKIFLSWSGERSKAVSELLDEWLQCVIQAVDPWMSTKGIDRGAIWFDEISSQLQDTSIGVICLTKENLNKPWILFEAGALAKGLKSSLVCTFLIDLESENIDPPLSQFNNTMPNEAGLWSLVTTLNNSLESNKRLKEKTLLQVFDTYWPQFEAKFNDVIKNTPDKVKLPERDEGDVLNEILQTTRNMDKRVRSLEKFSTFDKKLMHNSINTDQDRDIYNFLNKCIKSKFPDEVIINLLSKTFKKEKAEAEDYLSNFSKNEYIDFL